MPTTQKIEFTDKNEFSKAELDENTKLSVVHVTSLNLRSKIITHLAGKMQIAMMLAEKVIVLAKY